MQTPRQWLWCRSILVNALGVPTPRRKESEAGVSQWRSWVVVQLLTKASTDSWECLLAAPPTAKGTSPLVLKGIWMVPHSVQADIQRFGKSEIQNSRLKKRLMGREFWVLYREQAGWRCSLAWWLGLPDRLSGPFAVLPLPGHVSSA